MKKNLQALVGVVLILFFGIAIMRQSKRIKHLEGQVGLLAKTQNAISSTLNSNQLLNELNIKMLKQDIEIMKRASMMPVVVLPPPK